MFWRLLLTWCVQCVVVLLLVVVMAASPSLFISSQEVASWQTYKEEYEEVSVECSSGEGVAMSYLVVSGICV